MASLGGFERVELPPGAALLPGLIEPHCHVHPAALLNEWVDLGPSEGQRLRAGYSVCWLAQTIQAGEPFMPDGWWVMGRSIDPAALLVFPRWLSQLLVPLGPSAASIPRSCRWRVCTSQSGKPFVQRKPFKNLHIHPLMIWPRVCTSQSGKPFVQRKPFKNLHVHPLMIWPQKRAQLPLARLHQPVG